MTAIPRSQLRGLYHEIRSYKDALLEHVGNRFTPDCTVEHISDGRKGKYLGPLIDGTTVYLIIALEDGGSPVQELPGWWQQVRL